MKALWFLVLAVILLLTLSNGTTQSATGIFTAGFLGLINFKEEAIKYTVNTMIGMLLLDNDLYQRTHEQLCSPGYLTQTVASTLQQCQIQHPVTNCTARLPFRKGLA